MLQDLDPEEIRRAVGHQVEVEAFGITYHGRLEKYDEDNCKLLIKDGKDKVYLEQDRIEGFRVL